MLDLIIDTSTDLCLIAISQGGNLLSERIFAHENELSQSLLPSIQELMEANGLFPADLSSIAIGIGPGSYTGTRVGAAVAKSLAFGLGILLKPFYSPLAFLPGQVGSFAFLIPTRTGAYFLLKEKGPSLISPEELEAAVGATDTLVISASHAVPECLGLRRCVKASPNLPFLIQFLRSVEPKLPENVELQYLHTPF